MIPRTVTHQALLSMGSPRQEYWIVLPFPSPGDLPDPGIKPESPESARWYFITDLPGRPCHHTKLLKYYQILCLLCVCVCVCVCACCFTQLFANPGTIAHQALLSRKFSKQEYWSGFPFPTLGDLSVPRDQNCISCISCISRHHWEAQLFYNWKICTS